MERAINTMALENDGRKNTVQLRMGGYKKGIDYLTSNLVNIFYFHIVTNFIRLTIESLIISATDISSYPHEWHRALVLGGG